MIHVEVLYRKQQLATTVINEDDDVRAFNRARDWADGCIKVCRAVNPRRFNSLDYAVRFKRDDQQLRLEFDRL